MTLLFLKQKLEIMVQWCQNRRGVYFPALCGKMAVLNTNEEEKANFPCVM